MRARAGCSLILPILSIGLVLMAGCKTVQQCDTNGDCGGVNCSENREMIVSSTCVDGKCIQETTECETSEICVQDSRGALCLPKDPDTNNPIISCSSNTINPMVLSLNPANFICADDCPADSFCNNSCVCELKSDISCVLNTANTDAAGVNVFDATIEMCGDDCPSGSACSGQCLCEEYDCPEPIFTDNYFDPPEPIPFDTLFENWLLGPEHLYDGLEEADTISITGYRHVYGDAIFLIPFPEIQLELKQNPNNDPIHKDGWEGYCANDYYEGDEALDINYQWLDRPIQTCSWGGTVSYEGVITVCREILSDWFYEMFGIY